MEGTIKNNGAIRSYKDLIVWSASMNLAHEVYNVTEAFPKSERFALTSQMRRAAISIPSNIAEGWGRNSAASFSYFLKIAFGSYTELMTQLELAYRINYLSGEQLDKFGEMGESISKMIFVLIQKSEAREKFSVQKSHS
jgi:four helix bundle protein